MRGSGSYKDNVIVEEILPPNEVYPFDDPPGDSATDEEIADYERTKHKYGYETPR